MPGHAVKAARQRKEVMTQETLHKFPLLHRIQPLSPRPQK